jgi:hypothetical protein
MTALTLTRDAAGEFVLPAELLAERFGWPAETLQGLMRRGLVASRVERGEGEDEGRFRLSVRCGNRRWRAVVEADGKVSHQHFEVLQAAAR